MFIDYAKSFAPGLTFIRVLTWDDAKQIPAINAAISTKRLH